MPPTRTLYPRPRQDPVSCNLCRSKKLKCDRQWPCSNCQSRHLTCEYKGERPHASDAVDDDVLRAENKAIKARLARLEQAVFGQQSSNGHVAANHASISTAASTPSRPKTDGEKAHEDSDWLESIGTRSVDILPQFTDPYSVTIRTIDQIVLGHHDISVHREIHLPTREVAMKLLDAYAEHLDAVQHIMHIDNTVQAFDRAYSQAESGQRVEPGAMTLILGVCATLAFYRTTGFQQATSVFEDSEIAIKISTEWAKQSLLALEQARISTSSTTLEAIQGSILLTFLFYHLEGFTGRVRLMHATAIAMAKDLGLHKTDLPGRTAPTGSQAAIIDTEVRRKVWWHLSCTDWLLSFVGGPLEGSYSIHPQQMHVNMPRNLTRNDLNTKGPDFARSLAEPTLMSYYLQRIRLASGCREVADALWNGGPADIDYNLIHDLDEKFESQAHELPRFLRCDIPSSQLRSEYGEAYDRQVDIQGMMVNLMLNTRRCKLHLPFLIRAKSDPRFAFSRRMGLQAARMVFNVRRVIAEDDDTIGAAHLKLGGILQHVFYATVVLVMDLCVNKDDDQERLVEVREALQIMQNASSCSHMGIKFFDSLMAILRKHHVKLPAVQPPDTNMFKIRTNRAKHLELNQPSRTNPTSISGRIAVEDPSASMEVLLEPDEMDFDGGMFQDFLNQGPYLDVHDWDDLLRDLDMRMG